MRPSNRGIRLLAAIALSTLASVVVAADKAPEAGSLRTQFPATSIDSVGRADEALGATAGAKARVEKVYKEEARDCAKTFLVNACLDRARELQRKRLAEIDAVELEANRFKRKDRSDRLEADRARRDAERVANQKADSDLRARNRQGFDDKQAQAQREAADRARSDSRRANTSTPHKPAIKVAPASDAEKNARQRARNAVDHDTKLKDAAVHQAEIKRRMAAKEADRKRRAEEKAAKEARSPSAAPAKP